MSRQDTQLNTIILCSCISSKIKLNTVNPVLGLSGHFKTDYRLMQVKSIAECSKGSKGSILQYFRPSLSYTLSLRSYFV